jgi:DNA-binding CsgD family transcriptional regulator
LIEAELGETNVLFRAYTACAHASMAWGQGDVEVAWQQIRAVLADGPNTEPGDLPFGPALELQRLAVNLAIDQGHLHQARAWLEAHDRWLTWGGAVRRQADTHLLWARYHHSRGDSDAARHLGGRALHLARDPAQPLTLLAAHRFVGQLDIEAGRYADAEQHFGEALVLADACAAPFERALTLLPLAELRAATGTLDEARALVDQARDLCIPLGARPTIARAEALAARLIARPVGPGTAAGLTAREADVLRLVAQGLTDAEVAERLYMARRTVNTHLTSIYTKLGVSNRAAATRWAVENHIV